MRHSLERTLRECVLMGGEIVGSDGNGKDGLTGYLTNIARTDPRAYLALLGRLVPLQLHSTTETTFRPTRASKKSSATWKRAASPPSVSPTWPPIWRPVPRATANGGGLN